MIGIPTNMQQRRRPSQAVVDTNVPAAAVAKAARGTVTLRECMANYLMERAGQGNPLHRASAFFQEWTVIQWAKVEEQPSFISFSYACTYIHTYTYAYNSYIPINNTYIHTYMFLHTYICIPT